MKLIYLLGLLPLVGFGQNLKPDETAAIEFDVMPKQTTYIGKNKIAFKPLGSNDFAYRSTLENNLNQRIYTIVENSEQSDLYFTFHYSTVVTTAQSTTSKTETKTKKDGSTYTVTTFSSTQSNRLTVEVAMYTMEGERIKMESRTQNQNYTGSGNTRNDAINNLNSNKANSEASGLNDMFRGAFSAIEAEYLIDGQTLTPSTFFIKSRKEDYSDMNRAHELLAAWFKAKTYNADDAGYVEAMQLIDKALQEHDPNSKKSRIDNEVAAVCYYYKAYAYFALKQYKEANEAILKSEELDKRIHYTQERLKDMMNLMKERKMFA